MLAQIKILNGTHSVPYIGASQPGSLARGFVLVPKLCLGTQVLEAPLPDASPISGKQSLPKARSQAELGNEKNTQGLLLKMFDYSVPEPSNQSVFGSNPFRQ